MQVPEFQYFEETYTSLLKRLLDLGRNETNPYFGSKLFVLPHQKNCAYNLKMAELCYRVNIRQGVHLFFLLRQQICKLHWFLAFLL